jgi:hypothetical protein
MLHKWHCSVPAGCESAGKTRAIQARNEELARKYLARRSKPGGLSDSALMQTLCNLGFAG